MADWIHKTTLQYHVSISETKLPDPPASNYVKNPLPDRATILAIAQKYRKLTVDTVSEMNQTEKDAVDAADAAAAATADKAYAKAENEKRYLKGLVLALLDEINDLRDEHSLAHRTPAQAKTAIENKIDSL